MNRVRLDEQLELENIWCCVCVCVFVPLGLLYTRSDNEPGSLPRDERENLPLGPTGLSCKPQCVRVIKVRGVKEQPSWWTELAAARSRWPSLSSIIIIIIALSLSFSSLFRIKIRCIIYVASRRLITSKSKLEFPLGICPLTSQPLILSPTTTTTTTQQDAKCKHSCRVGGGFLSASWLTPHGR